ncbi:MAG: hypothetical protein PVJ43_09845 [Gemmatimonadales bacterium]|jgi:hypothetical protein
MGRFWRRVHVTFAKPAEYCIVVEGQLEEELSDRLGGMHIDSAEREHGTWVTILTGRISDQAELNGVLNSLYDMHVPIISVQATGV